MIILIGELARLAIFFEGLNHVTVAGTNPLGAMKPATAHGTAVSCSLKNGTISLKIILGPFAIGHCDDLLSTTLHGRTVPVSGCIPEQTQLKSDNRRT